MLEQREKAALENLAILLPEMPDLMKNAFGDMVTS